MTFLHRNLNLMVYRMGVVSNYIAIIEYCHKDLKISKVSDFHVINTTERVSIRASS